MKNGFSLPNFFDKAQPEDSASGMTRAQRKHFPRTQDRVLVVGTRDDCLILRDASVVAAVGFGSIDDTLLAEAQIDGMLDAFKSFLCTLRFDIQLLIGTRSQNLDALSQKLLQHFDRCAEHQKRVIALRDKLERYCVDTLTTFSAASSNGMVVDVPARFCECFGFAPQALRGTPGEAGAIAHDLSRADFFAEWLHAQGRTTPDASAVSFLVQKMRNELDRSIDLLDHWEQLLLGRRTFLDAMLQRVASPVRVLHWVTRAQPRSVTGAVKRGPMTEGEFRSGQRELGERCALLLHAMQRMGLPAWRATSEELIQDIAQFYHPSQSQLAHREARFDRSVVAQMATVQESQP